MSCQLIYSLLSVKAPIENVALVVASNHMGFTWRIVGSEVLTRIEKLLVFECLEAFVYSEVEDVQGGTLFASYQDVISI